MEAHSRRGPHTAVRSLLQPVTTEAAGAGVIGAYAYMGPKAGRDVFRLAPETADLTFGAVTVLTGVVGTVGARPAVHHATTPQTCIRRSRLLPRPFR